MKPQETNDFKWVGTDLHVHTPASKDYKGRRDESEYVRLIQSANQFHEVRKDRHSERNNERNPIGCIVFTDHNSVEGFVTYRTITEETDRLSKAIRNRDSDNPLAPILERDLETLRSVRILMGVEIKANPGIHVLVVFAESVDADEVRSGNHMLCLF